MAGELFVSLQCAGFLTFNMLRDLRRLKGKLRRLLVPGLMSFMEVGSPGFSQSRWTNV